VAGNCNFFAGQVLVHNCLIIDDPVKDREAAESEVLRERAWEWWESVAMPRLASPPVVILMMTRWQEDDLAGRILSRPSPLRWRVLSLPAIAEDNDPLGRRPGEEFPSVRGRPPGHFANIRAGTSVYVFASIYQQRPGAAEGNFFRRASFRYWKQARGFPDPGAALAGGAQAGAWMDLEGRRVDLADPAVWRFATCDVAASTKTSADWTVISVWAITREGDLVLLDRARGHAAMSDHFAMAAPLRQRWRFDVLYVEKQFYSQTLVLDARTAGMPVAEVDADTDKITRAIPAAGRVHAGKVWFPAVTSGCTCGNCGPSGQWLEEWENEVALFPRGSHDDQVDTLSYAARIAAAHWIPPVPAKRPPALPRDLAEIEQAFDAATGNGGPGNGSGHRDIMTMPLG
jgi:predicted phage terminase large subunit-like protein